MIEHLPFRVTGVDVRGPGVRGPTAMAPVAIGALAVGAVAIGRLAIGRATIKRLTIDELEVTRLKGDRARGRWRAPPVDLSSRRTRLRTGRRSRGQDGPFAVGMEGRRGRVKPIYWLGGPVRIAGAGRAASGSVSGAARWGAADHTGEVTIWAAPCTATARSRSSPATTQRCVGRAPRRRRRGLGDHQLHLAGLESDIAASRAAYVALAVTEIASLRGQVSTRSSARALGLASSAGAGRREPHHREQGASGGRGADRSARARGSRRGAPIQCARLATPSGMRTGGVCAARTRRARGPRSGRGGAVTPTEGWRAAGRCAAQL